MGAGAARRKGLSWALQPHGAALASALLSRCRGGSCSDGWCPRFLETPLSLFWPHGPSLQACWWVQALERATGHGGLRGSHALDPEAGGHSVGSRAGLATLPSSCPPLSFMRCSEALET